MVTSLCFCAWYAGLADAQQLSQPIEYAIAATAEKLLLQSSAVIEKFQKDLVPHVWAQDACNASSIATIADADTRPMVLCFSAAAL